MEIRDVATAWRVRDGGRHGSGSQACRRFIYTANRLPNASTPDQGAASAVKPLEPPSATRGDRHMVQFGYAKAPGMIGRLERIWKVCGHVPPVHIEAEEQRRNDGLLS
jgi:hypothetical protein